MTTRPFTDSQRGFNIQPGISVDQEPIERTFENILARDGQFGEAFAWVVALQAWQLNELDTALALAGHDDVGVANGVDLPMSEGIITSDSTQIDLTGGDTFTLAEGHSYILQCFVQHTLMGNNRQSVWGWHDGTVFQGFASTVDGSADVGGAVPCQFLTAKLVGPGSYTVRRASGTANDGNVVAQVAIQQGRPGEPPPEPPEWLELLGAGTQINLANNNGPIEGPWPP